MLIKRTARWFSFFIYLFQTVMGLALVTWVIICRTNIDCFVSFPFKFIRRWFNFLGGHLLSGKHICWVFLHVNKHWWVLQFTWVFICTTKILQSSFKISARWFNSVLSSFFSCTAACIECFHMTSWRPYLCPKTMRRRPWWCPKPIQGRI